MGRFQKIHACSVGNFNGKGDKIPQWITANGGRYSKSVHETVTHLIASKEAFKKNVEAVKKAKDLNVKIVLVEWLEDSLLSKSKTPKRESQYLLENILKETQKAAKAKKQKQRSKKRAGTVKDPFAPGSRGKGADYHIYIDPEDEVYNVSLFRYTILKAREKFQLKIYESNSNPPVYATQAKYSRTGTSKVDILAPLGSSLDIAMVAFKEFFLQNTGTTWEQKMENIPAPAKKDSDGNTLPHHQGWYFYEPQVGILSNFLRKGPYAGE